MVFHGLLLIVVLFFSSAFAPKPPPAVIARQPTSRPTVRPTKSPTAHPTNFDGFDMEGGNTPPTNGRDRNPSATPTLGGDPLTPPTGPRTPQPKGPMSPSVPTKILVPPPVAGGQGGGGNGPQGETPIDQPTYLPTAQPTNQPSSQPTSQATNQPTHLPTGQPTAQPSHQPTSHPVAGPTRHPTAGPPSHFISFPPTRPAAPITDNVNDNPPPTPGDKIGGKPPIPPTRPPSGAPTRDRGNSLPPQPSAPIAKPSHAPVQKQAAGDDTNRINDGQGNAPSQSPSKAPTEGFVGIPTSVAPLGPTDQVAGDPKESLPPAGVVVHGSEPTTYAPTKSDQPNPDNNAIADPQSPLDTVNNPEPSDNTVPVGPTDRTRAPTIYTAHGDAPVSKQQTLAPTSGINGGGDGQTPDTMGRPTAQLPTPDNPTPDNPMPDNGNPDNINPGTDNGNTGNPDNGPFGNGRPVSVIVRQRQGGIVRQPGIKTTPGNVLNAPETDNGNPDSSNGGTTDELQPASRGLSGGAIAGIVVGVLVGVAGVAALAAFAVNAFLSRPPSAVTAMSDEEVYYQMI